MKKKLHGFAALVAERGKQQDAERSAEKMLMFGQRYGLHEASASEFVGSPPRDKAIYAQIIAKMGKKHQMTVAIEELSELIKELTKAIRGRPNDMKISEEVADVEVCLDQLRFMYDPDGSKVRMYKDFKLQRLGKFYIDGGHR
jgi:hypothetical protein